MEHGPLELLARLIHVGATGDAGERVPWAELSTGQREAMTSEAVAMLSITVAVGASGERVERPPDAHGARRTRRGRARA